jgi:hypothetical protein
MLCLSQREFSWMTNVSILLNLVPAIFYFITDYLIYKMNSQYNDQKIHNYLLFGRVSVLARTLIQFIKKPGRFATGSLANPPMADYVKR